MARGKGYRLAQPLLLKQMLRSWHRVTNARRQAIASAKMALSPKQWRYINIVSDEGNRKRCGSSDIPTDVPRGHFAVYVGNNRRRFVVPTTYLTHPLFRVLLQKAEEEFGFDHQMGLTIPCEEVAFEYLTSLLGKKDPSLSNLELDELIDFYQDGSD